MTEWDKMGFGIESAKVYGPYIDITNIFFCLSLAGLSVISEFVHWKP